MSKNSQINYVIKTGGCSDVLATKFDFVPVIEPSEVFLSLSLFYVTFMNETIDPYRKRKRLESLCVGM